MKNRYVERSRISEKKFREFLKLFAMDLEATKIAELSGLNRNTVNRFAKQIRVLMAEECEKEAAFNGVVEVDESFFGPKRVRGKRGRGAGAKTIVFGIFKRKGKVYTEIVSDCSKATLQGIIRGKVDAESVIHSDGWKGYNGLVDMEYKKHYRVRHSDDEFANRKSHINGIENFWGLAKARLAKFRGLSKEMFYFHLKETEFRLNHRNESLYSILLKTIRNRPLS